MVSKLKRGRKRASTLNIFKDLWKRGGDASALSNKNSNLSNTGNATNLSTLSLLPDGSSNSPSKSNFSSLLPSSSKSRQNSMLDSNNNGTTLLSSPSASNITQLLSSPSASNSTQLLSSPSASNSTQLLSSPSVSDAPSLLRSIAQSASSKNNSSRKSSRKTSAASSLLSSFVPDTIPSEKTQKVSSSRLKSSSNSASPTSTLSNSTYNVIIGFLLLALTISLIGESGIKGITDFFSINVVGAVSNLSSNIAYTFGTLLNTVTNLVTNTAVTGIEVAGGAANEVGDILRDSAADSTDSDFRRILDRAEAASQKPFLSRGIGAYPDPGTSSGIPAVPPITKPGMNLGTAINDSNKQTLKYRKEPTQDDGASSSIQGPIRATQPAFCFIGSFDKERACVQVQSGDICNSGFLFPTRETCEAPV